MIKLSSILLIFSFIFGSLQYSFRPTLVFDATENGRQIGSYASGHLYGLSEDGVPSRTAVESLDISSVSQKVIDGLQHPTGDVDHVAGMLDGADYIVVYLQDSFPTWYYEHGAIETMRNEGRYDWHEFMTETFFPLIKDSVLKLKNAPYHDRLIYCPYNECDNGIWFGNQKGSSAQFDEIGKENFYSAWKETCAYIRSLDDGAKIGGPGYFEYNSEKISSFLEFCEENDCLPDIMIYHELSERSAMNWDLDVTDERAIEARLGINEIPIIVTEYGTMEECGNPSKMMPYILQAEKCKTYGNIAFWRLANNLNDNLADANIPNSCWWLYRWYADMSGTLLTADTKDLFHGDFGKAVKEGRQMRYKYLKGFGAINESKDRIDIIAGGASYASDIVIKNLGKTDIGKKVNVKIEAVEFEGLSGAVYSPVVLKQYVSPLPFGKLKINLGKMNGDRVYHITVSKASESARSGVTAELCPAELPVRYEFERGTLLGSAYTYDSAYATTGETAGMVGGMENIGDGVSLSINVPKDGDYLLSFIYGKANDGKTRTTGKPASPSSQ